ncbi:MAG TPA: alcohol dehydrogenase [Candidatus Fraserbacteria bacterium]|nr:alcohol dehydrogenase [Candidatus Fraserbacteria bacterium]
MKAIRIHQHGGPEVLRYEEVPDPVAGPDEVLVQVRACALNHLDIFVRQGLPGIALPHIPGADVAGVIAEVGAQVQGLSQGQRIIVNPSLSCGHCEYCIQGQDSLCDSYRILGEQVDGGYAEYLAVPADNVHLIPDGFSFEEAAAVPLVYQTAWRLLVSRAQLKAGEDILILGAGGGVASAAIQIAKLCGARVWATSSSSVKLERARELGVDVLINYKTSDFAKEIRRLTDKRGVDVVLDNVGEATWEQSLRSLAKNGRLVTCGATSGPRPPTDIRLVFWRQLQIFGSTMANRHEFSEVLRLVWQGKLKPVVDRSFPLGEAAAAQRALEAGEHFGKLVLVP